ncbi:transposase domain-containing protein [Actinosynnema sp. NPDC023587]|uniref:transposase domain-containing protein n=1 Tax=Actinosynnema sp. NPDC023587 TaxID=3154695 RepID=UPI0033C62062
MTRTVTVAAGRFAPGHLGELTRVVPFELVDAILEGTRRVQRRSRDLVPLAKSLLPVERALAMLGAVRVIPALLYKVARKPLSVPSVSPAAQA